MSENERLRQIRQMVGLAQTKFASSISISSSYLARMETGDKPVNERTMRLICQEYGVDEHWFRTGEGSMFNREADTKALKATSLFKMLSPQFQDFALAHLNELVELCNSTKTS